MGFKFNRGCWVESHEDGLLSCKAGDGNIEGSARTSPPSTVQRIDLAHSLFRSFEEALRNHRIVVELLHRIDQDIDRTARAMAELGIDEACALCDRTSPCGSCCSRGLEKKYDSVLLLINLLLGRDLPDTPTREDSCHFLGHRGCRLRIRHMLCIDYLCPGLETRLGTAGLIRIQSVAGMEIHTAFLLYEAVKKVIRE